MKKSIAICLLIFLTVIGNGQVNKKSYYSEFNQDQLNLALVKAKKNISTGRILTFGGLFTTVTGTLLLAGGLVIDDPDKSLNVSLTGTFVSLGGLIVTLVGIPVWVSGANKKRGIEIELVKFNSSRSTPINGLGLTIRF